MPDSLSQPFTDFCDDLARLERLLGVIGQLRDFGTPAVPNGLPADEFLRCAVSLRSSVRAESAEFPILSGTLLLFVAGRFEHFVRVSFEALCDSLSEKCTTFADLPDKMRSNLVAFTAEVLAKPSKYGFDDVSLRAAVHNLAANMKADCGLGEVNSKCLSITDQNMHPGMLADLYKRVGVSVLWKELSKQARLKMYFESDKDDDVERAARAALENLMSMRNNIAHPTATPTSFPDVDGVKGHIAFVRVLSEVLTDVSRVQLAAFKTKASA